ncbi:MAG: AmmeMemoRadiSam system protein A [Desulfocapsa sp.]|uniref:AmmeMemoRadiSam system protein A n=1 Tax=Desulfotalea psychrophila TaxID=84980 RepID=A0ABS3AVZ3_9BACT|nr:AmmeMemoRadiSam system protein A [Desulfocapsa sp.]MBN4068700.1 AmmeMemoRadiSam system protein A [Desulfotalea psychrophila]
MDELLTKKQGKKLLQLARQTIAGRLIPILGTVDVTDADFDVEYGTFVTLKLKGALRGCIGNLLPNEPVSASIQRNAISAAFHDSRFSPLTAAEFEDVKIDISILSPPQTLEYKDSAELISKLRPGIDGVTVTLGGARATFLPQVWGQLPAPELFLNQLCKKAGLAESAWKDSHPEIEIYQVQCFEEE